MDQNTMYAFSNRPSNIGGGTLSITTSKERPVAKALPVKDTNAQKATVSTNNMPNETNGTQESAKQDDKP